MVVTYYADVYMIYFSSRVKLTKYQAAWAASSAWMVPGTYNPND